MKARHRSLWFTLLLASCGLSALIHGRLELLPHAWQYYPELFLGSLWAPAAVLLSPALAAGFFHLVGNRRNGPPQDWVRTEHRPAFIGALTILLASLCLLGQGAVLRMLHGYPLDLVRLAVVFEAAGLVWFGVSIAGVRYPDSYAQRWGPPEAVHRALGRTGRFLWQLGAVLLLYCLLGAPAVGLAGGAALMLAFARLLVRVR